MQKNINSTLSSYKLNSSIIHRMVCRKLTCSSGHTYPGCTKLMIAALIHFSHICSPSGIINEYKIKDLELVLRCSNRAAYQVIKDLEKREFIKIENLNSWTGAKRITILNNDFSNYSENDYKKSRYLNTNFSFFNYRENKNYDKFLNLSLYSMRLLILLLHNYSFDKGYHSSFDNLCRQLGIKRRALVHKYLEEIKFLFQDRSFIAEQKNKQRRLRYGSIAIKKNISELNSSNNVLTDQNDTYYNYLWKSKLKSIGLGVSPELATSLHTFCNRICKLVNFHLKKNPLFKLDFIENIIWNIITDNYVLDDATLTEIDQRLRALAV